MTSITLRTKPRPSARKVAGLVVAAMLVNLWTAPAFALCGDTIPDPGEICDDGNLVDGDGCDSNCTITGCGNLIVTAGEACDAGPSGSAACDPDCTPPACGDGTTNPFTGEQCDDANLVSGDGCDGNCTLTSCGNGIVTPPEQCDDGNLVNNDGCDANCTAPACGNGLLNPPEQCDDNNVTNDDGCDGNCTPTGCGNGVTTAGEQCDDGNVANGDGCDANCTLTGCGNGVAAGFEQCDNGPANGTDLCCSATCQRIDADSDGICDRDDVCPNTADPSQTNSDGDIFGDACDICPSDENNDSDNDRFCTGPTFNSPALGGGDPCSRAGNAGTWNKPKALFSHLGVPGGDDKMNLKGRFNVGNLLPSIAPHINGVHIRVTDANGGLIVDEEIPGGSPSALRGWKVSGGAHNQWTYKDRTQPPVQNGISQIVIKNLLFIDPTLFAVVVKGDKGTYPLQPGKEPVRVTVELNANALPSGGTPGRDQCGEIQYLDLAKPRCTFNKFKLTCK